MGQIDPKIIEAVVRPEGVTEAELQEINSDFRDHLQALRRHGMHLFEKTIDGLITYSTVELQASPAPAPSSAAAPPAEAPRSPQPAETPPEETPDTLGGYDARLTVETFKVRSREGRPPVIEMIPSGPIGAQVATLFSMQKPKKAIVMVYLKILSEGPTEEKAAPPEREASPAEKQELPAPPPGTTSPAGDAPETIAGAPATESRYEGGDDVVEPKDYGTIQINSTSKSHEKKPEAKSKEQIARELSEQINAGELTPGQADAMSKLGGL